MAREFWLGLSTPTIAGWVAAVCFAVLEFWCCCLWVSPRHLAKLDARFVMESTRDDYARVSVALARFRISSPKAPQVVYLGSSQAKFALTSWDDEALSKDLSEVAGFEVDFHDCATDLQHYEDALFVIDQFPKTFRGVVLVAIDDHRDSPPEIRRVRRGRWVGSPAPAFDAMQKERGIERRATGVWFLDHIKFFAARRVAAIRIGAPLWNPYPNEVGVRDANSVAKAKQEIARKQQTVWRGPPPAISNAAPRLRAIVERLDARGIRTVFFDPPRNPVRLSIEAERIADYDDRIPLFAEELGAEYWLFDQEIGLKAGDFTDSVHVRTVSGRQRFQRALFRRVATWLKNAGLATGSGASDPEEPAEP